MTSRDIIFFAIIAVETICLCISVGCWIISKEHERETENQLQFMHGQFLRQIPPRDHPEEKATILLQEWLSPAQRADYYRDYGFWVTGSATGTHYWIDRRIRSYNVLAPDVGMAYCFEPRCASDGILPAGDIMLAQKIMLELDETAALKAANKRKAHIGYLRLFCNNRYLFGSANRYLSVCAS